MLDGWISLLPTGSIAPLNDRILGRGNMPHDRAQRRWQAAAAEMLSSMLARGEAARQRYLTQIDDATLTPRRRRLAARQAEGDRLKAARQAEGDRLKAARHPSRTRIARR